MKLMKEMIHAMGERFSSNYKASNQFGDGKKYKEISSKLMTSICFKVGNVGC